MSCYFRHLKEVFAAAGVSLTPQNKKALDQALHQAAGVGYKNCPAAWRKLKLQLQGTKEEKEALIAALKELH